MDVLVAILAAPPQSRDLSHVPPASPRGRASLLRRDLALDAGAARTRRREQAMTDSVTITSLIDQALEPGASAQHVAAAAAALPPLGEGAGRGDPAAEATSQRALYELHTRSDASTAAIRRWLAAWTYPV